MRYVIFFLIVVCSSSLAGQSVTSLPFQALNSPYDEQAPVLSPDGRALYFTVANHPSNIGGVTDPGDIWVSIQLNGAWQKPIHGGREINHAGYNAVAGISADGTELYLLGHYTSTDALARTQGFSIARRKGNDWQRPENVSIPYFLNKSDRFSGYVDPSMRVFIYSAESYESRGVEDLYVTVRRDAGWSEPINLGSTINTPLQEWTPWLSADLRTLYFASNGHAGHGGFDIFSSTRQDESWTSWSKPQNLAEPINSDGRDLYYRDSPFVLFTTTRNSDRYANFVTLDNANTAPRADTLAIVEKKYDRATGASKKVKLVGTVTDSKTGKGINAELVFKSDSSQLKTSTRQNRYALTISSTQIYSIEVRAPGHINLSERLDIHTLELQMLELNFKLQPIEVGAVVNLKNVLFTMGTTELLPESYDELNVVLDFLNSNPRVEILLEGHTDNRGDPSLNVILSQQRVDRIKSYLVTHGITAKRIRGKGYGSSRPLTTADNEESRRLNRRVEFVIVKD